MRTSASCPVLRMRDAGVVRTTAVQAETRVSERDIVPARRQRAIIIVSVSEQSRLLARQPHVRASTYGHVLSERGYGMTPSAPSVLRGGGRGNLASPPHTSPPERSPGLLVRATASSLPTHIRGIFQRGECADGNTRMFRTRDADSLPWQLTRTAGVVLGRKVLACSVPARRAAGHRSGALPARAMSTGPGSACPNVHARPRGAGGGVQQ